MEIKRLLFNGVYSKVSENLLFDINHSFQLQKIIAVTDQISLLSQAQFDGINFFALDYNKLIFADYPFLPVGQVDQQLMDKLGSSVLTLLKMMDRLPQDKVYSFESRIQMLWRHLTFWNHILLSEKIDCFISVNIPHEIFDYSIYLLCKVHGIQTIFFSQSQIEGYLQIFESIEENDDAFSEWKSVKDLSMTEHMQKYYFSQKNHLPAPFYMQSNVEHFKKSQSFVSKFSNRISYVFGLFKKTFNFNNFEFSKVIRVLYFIDLFGKKAEQELYKKEFALSEEPNLDTQYIFIPLHYQPECTTSPQGGIFVYQEFLIQLVSAHLPNGFKIYIKEHPVQKLHGRDQLFYDRLKSIPHVHLVHRSFSSKELLKNCKALATVTGTAAWEAIFQNKPVFLFGDIFFKYAPGVYSIKSKLDMKIAFDDLLKSESKQLEDQNIKKFLKLVEQNMIIAWLDPVYEKTTPIDFETNRKNLASAVIYKIKNKS